MGDSSPTTGALPAFSLIFASLALGLLVACLRFSCAHHRHDIRMLPSLTSLASRQLIADLRFTRAHHWHRGLLPVSYNTQGGMSPAVRPMTSSGRPVTGFARPGTSSRTGFARPGTSSRT
eukprot:1153875-Pelagomonas_calceolata.AAC.1